MSNKLGAGGHPRVARNRSPWADALRARRQELGLSTYQAAAALNVSQGSVTAAETGRWSISEAKARERLAAYDAWALTNESPGPGTGPELGSSGSEPGPRRPHRKAVVR